MPAKTKHPLTKIVATLGPASEDEKTVREMIEAGVNVARINCSHGDWDMRHKRIKHVRKISKELGVSVAILLDLQGPKIRTSSKIPEEGIDVKEGETLVFTVNEDDMDIASNPKKIYINYPELASEVKKGQRILLDDGLLRMQVESIEKKDVVVKVIFGGKLKPKKGVNLPESKQLSIQAITEKDRLDLAEAVKAKVDFIALSFVRKAQDILDLRELVEQEETDRPYKIIAKIEKPQALDCLDEILDVSDGVMVARGDLGVELDPEKVPMVQKHIISRANSKNCIVITATQMMESMIKNPFPTRAEVSDVANAIIDGTDAVMLSGETASGSFPIEAVSYMSKIALETESKLRFAPANLELAETEQNQNLISIASGVKNFVQLDHINNIVALSCSGASVRIISKFRPKARVIAATTYEHTYNYLAMVWGVTPLYFDQVDHTTTTLANLEEELIKEEIIQEGETVVVTGGLPIVARSSANFIKLHKCDGWIRSVSSLKKYTVHKDLGPLIDK